MASAAGGMDIEEVAHATPEKILTVTLHPAAGLQDYQARKLGFGLGLDRRQQGELRDILAQARHACFSECDASLVEINPLIVTQERPCRRARREDQRRRQRAVPAAAACEHARRGPRGRARASGARARSQLRLARRQHRLHGQRRGPRDGHDGPHQAARRGACQLPRRRRRRDGRARRGGIQDHPHQQERQSAILVNIFGGIVRCDLIAEGVIAAVAKCTSVCPSSCGWKARTSTRAASCSRRAGFEIVAATGLTDAASKVVDLAGAALMSILVDANTKVICQGLTGRQGTFHTEQCLDYGTKVVAGRHARAGAARHIWACPCTTRWPDAQARHGCDREHDLRAGAVCGRRDPRGGRCRYRARRLHYGGRARARHGQRQGRAPGRGLPADRAELSRASSRRAAARSASCPAPSISRARSASCRAPEP